MLCYLNLVLLIKYGYNGNMKWAHVGKIYYHFNKKKKSEKRKKLLLTSTEWNWWFESRIIREKDTQLRKMSFCTQFMNTNREKSAFKTDLSVDSYLHS